MRSPPLLVRFPAGIPFFNGTMGYNDVLPPANGMPLVFNDFDLLWVAGGEGLWRLNSGQTLRARKDEFVLLPPCLPVLWLPARSSINLWYCHFAFRAWPERIAAPLRPDLAPPQVSVPMCFSRAQAPGVWQAYRALSRLKVGADRPWRLDAALLALLSALHAFGAAHRPRGDEIQLSPTLDRRIELIRQRVAADPSFAWSVPELARIAGLSASHLHALCRKYLGHSLKRHLVEARLRLALRLLKEWPEGQAPAIHEVSQRAGFSSQHYFARQFKSYFKVTPLAFRNGGNLL